MTKLLRVPLLLATLVAAACAAGPEDEPLHPRAAALQATPVALGDWAFDGSDVRPDTSYAIDGAALQLNFAGYYSWDGTWATGYHGYTFAAGADLIEGATYALTLDVSNVTGGIPVVLKAALSGGGPEQTQMRFGDGPLQMTFTVGALGDAPPVLEVTAHPVLGNIGPLQNLGIGFQTYRVTATLTPID
jgi:hypothetical protein